MKKKALILMCLSVCLLPSCKTENFDEDFTLDREVRMEISGKEIFRYNPITCQEFYNNENCSFCVGTDTMSDFFAVKFNALPVKEGQTVYGSIKWTTPTSISTKDNVTLTVAKLEGDRIWLWDASTRIGVVVRILY